MNKTELLEALEDSHQELVEMLEDLPDEVLLSPGVSGDWSIKDILAHLVHWEGQTVTLLFQVLRGIDQPTTAHFEDEGIDALNARWREESQARSIEAIWSDFIGVRKQMIRRVSELSEKDLTDQDRFSWMKGAPLIELILRDTVEHEEDHADAIREWLDQRDGQISAKSP